MTTTVAERNAAFNAVKVHVLRMVTNLVPSMFQSQAESYVTTSVILDISNAALDAAQQVRDNA